MDMDCNENCERCEWSPILREMICTACSEGYEINHLGNCVSTGCRRDEFNNGEECQACDPTCD